MPIISSVIIFSMWYAIGAMIANDRVEYGYTEKEAEDIRRIQLPYPGEIWDAIVEEREDLIVAAKNTFTAAVTGFLSAVVIGYLMAMILASFDKLKQAMYPWILILQMTPVVILGPIIVIWMGTGLQSITVITFLIGFFPVVANSTMGLVSVDKNLSDLFTVCNASRAQNTLLLKVPYSMPYFLTGMKIAGTLAPIGAISGDVFVGSSASGGAGLGFMTIVYNSNVKIPALFGTATIACVMGFVFVGAVNLIHWYALKNWHESVVNRNR